MNYSPTPFPGADNLNTVLGWLGYAGMLALLGFFILGIVQAGVAKKQHAVDRAEAPIWPLVGAGLLGSAGTIFMFFM